MLRSPAEFQVYQLYMNCLTFFFPCSKKFICYMNKYLCHVQDIVLLRIVVLQHLGILRNYIWSIGSLFPIYTGQFVIVKS